LATKQPRGRVVDRFDVRLGLLSGLVTADRTFQLKMRPNGVDDRFRHQRGASIVEVQDLFTPGVAARACSTSTSFISDG
jgi:hypothetical protein